MATRAKTSAARQQTGPTNRLRYVITRKNAPKLRVDAGVQPTPPNLPSIGDGKFVAGIACEVTGVLHTPKGAYTWTVSLKEH